MQDKPNSNSDSSQEEISRPPATVGGDQITIQGNVGVGASIGRGSVKADYIAGGNMVVNNGRKPEDKKEFVDLTVKLRRYIIEAHKAGELNETIARKALRNLNETTTLVTEEDSPPKGPILQRLQFVADVLEAAVDMFSSESGPAKVLLKALPIAALLIKVATRIF